MNLKELRERLAALNDQAKNLKERAELEHRDLTDQETDELEGILADFERTERLIAAAERLEAQTARASQQNGPRSDNAEPDPLVNRGAAGPTPPARRNSRPDDGLRNSRLDPENRQRWGWNNIGDFALAVRDASRGGSQPDPRLVNAPATYGVEAVGADGGFAVPPEFRAAIMQKVMGEESLLSRCDQSEVSGTGMTVPQDNTTPWQSTGGVQAYWDGEASQITQSKLALGEVTNKLHKLTALVPVTDELLADAPALTSWINRKAPEKIDFKVSDAIINGTGVGMPLGLMNSGSKVEVAKESSQPAATILGANIIKMFSRMYAPWRFGAVWFIHQDCEPQLFQMNIPVKNVAGTDNVGGFPVYMPPGGLSSSPYGTLMGRPVIPIQSCQTLGTAGDIIFASMSQYWAVVKAGGVRSDSSIHLFFDYGVTAFRFTFRMGGQPWYNAPVSPKNGSNTLGCFVTLATRS